MSTSKLVRMSGLMSLLAGILYAVGALLHPVGEGLAAVHSPNGVPAHLVYWISLLLLHLALVGLFAHLKEQIGLLGLVAFVLAFIGTALVSSILLYVSTVLPLIAGEAQGIFDQAIASPDSVQLLFLIGFGLGWILFGITILT